MHQDSFGRRGFLQGAALVGLGASVLSGEASASLVQAKPAQGKAKPLVISSTNGAAVPREGVVPAGKSCLDVAMEILKSGGDTLDAVVAGVNIVEDDPEETSVGYGGLPNEECEVELDASVMHGPTRRAGSVASLKFIKNPSKVAKLVLERTDHILIVGEGALKFAVKHGFKKEDLLTERARQAWLAWREGLNPKDNWGPSWHKTGPENGAKVSSVEDLSAEQLSISDTIREVLHRRPTGTINCLALDAKGDISGVTTTSGLAWKIPGRVGDSPIIGAGLYVDNEVGAAGSTGRGEENIYINGSHTIVEMMRQGKSPMDAALEACERIAHRYGNNKDQLNEFDITFYAINKDGEYTSASLWNGHFDSKKELIRHDFAVHDGNKVKVMKTGYLFERG